MVDLRPITKTENIGDLAAWAFANFQRISDEIDSRPVVDSGEEIVTGNIEIETDLPYVYHAVASLTDPPVAGAAIVRAISVNDAEDRGADFGNIIIEVYTDALVLSTTPITVSWFAMGTIRIP